MLGHETAPHVLDWSVSGDSLFTCSKDNAIWQWDVTTGACIAQFTKHTHTVQAVVSLPDGQHFASGGLDAHLFIWNIASGTVIREYTPPGNVLDLVVSPNGKTLFALLGHDAIYAYAMEYPFTETLVLRNTQSLNSPMMSMNISKKGDALLINVQNELLCYDLVKNEIVGKYTGMTQARYMVRAVFGGLQEAFIASGSEDAYVYIWRRDKCTRMSRLAGHTATVNTVAWHPTDPYLLASASDDTTIRLWGL